MGAILSVWIALGALVTSIVVIFTSLGAKEPVVILLPYTVAFSATLAAAQLWGLRKCDARETGVAGRRLQAWAAIAINSLTFALLLFWLNGLLRGLLGLGLEGGFLVLVYWLYTRVLVPDSSKGE